MLRFDVEDPVHGSVPCAALVHDEYRQRELPCCLVLYGGGGSREILAALQPVFERALPPCILAMPDVGPWSFCLDDPVRRLAWESFIVQRFVPHVRALQPTAAVPLGVVGMSMGGYGALKLAFARPQLFAAVGAVSPMVEPYGEAVPLRNRFFYPAEVPQALLGRTRDRALYHADHPVARARANARQLLDHKLGVYIDAAGRDALNAHDGAESLHRALWELDIPHEYHLRRDADHAGPDLAPRLCVALRWVLERLQPPAATPLTDLEHAWQAWLEAPTAPMPTTPLPADSQLFPTFLRATLAPQRTAAALEDPTSSRHYGILRG